MVDILVHTKDGELEPYKYPTLLEKIELEDEDAILHLYESSLERVARDRRSEYERTLLLFYRRVKKQGVGIWKQPHLSVNNSYWRAVIWKPMPYIHDPNRKRLVKWYCKADGGRWISDSGYPRRRMAGVI